MILEKNSFKDFGGNLFQTFWRKIVSRILEEISFKDFEGKFFQRFWRKIVSIIFEEDFPKILEENSFKDFGSLILIFFVFIFFFFIDKSCNLSKIVLVLIFASIERLFVSRMRDFFGTLPFYSK